MNEITPNNIQLIKLSTNSNNIPSKRNTHCDDIESMNSDILIEKFNCEVSIDDTGHKKAYVFNKQSSILL